MQSGELELRRDRGGAAEEALPPADVHQPRRPEPVTAQEPRPPVSARTRQRKSPISETLKAPMKLSRRGDRRGVELGGGEGNLGITGFQEVAAFCYF